MKEEKIKDFLYELMTLCKKYDAQISGCIFCGSPYVKFYKFDHIDEECRDLYAAPDRAEIKLKYENKRIGVQKA